MFYVYEHDDDCAQSVPCLAFLDCPAIHRLVRNRHNMTLKPIEDWPVLSSWPPLRGDSESCKLFGLKTSGSPITYPILRRSCRFQQT